MNDVNNYGHYRLWIYQKVEPFPSKKNEESKKIFFYIIIIITTVENVTNERRKRKIERKIKFVYEEIVVINLSIKILNFFLLLLLHHWARSRVNWLPFYIKFIFVKKTHAEILLVVVLAWRLCVRWHLKNNKKNFNDDDDDDVVGKLKFFFSFGGKRKKVMK
mgnify:CR=1 FL=1